jgi:uncharacterized protein
MSTYAEFRAEIDAFMQQHRQSPLSAEQKAGFTGLAYYEPDERWVLTTAVSRFPPHEPPLIMETSSGDTRLYHRWGRISFEVDGETASLTIFSDPDGEELFLPFRDATSGTETYGAGRYMDNHRPGLRRLGEGLLEVDFNMAYNPYCAYSDRYSCPLPPAENWLRVAVRAGEKKFVSEK